MTLKRKRSLLTASDRRRRRVDPDDNPPAPNPVPEEPDDKVYKAFFNRKSKLATLLTPNYKVYENLFRKVAEEFTIARRDALNFVLFMVIQWFNTQCVELFAYQTQQVPQIQIYLRRILHEMFLMNQLRDLLQQTTNSLQQTTNSLQQTTNSLQQTTNSLQQEQIIPNHQRLDELLVELNNNINSQEGQLEYEQQRTAQDNLSLHIHLVLLDLHPQFTDLRTVTARAAEAAENVKTTTEERLTALFNSVTENQQAALQNARNLRDLERKILALRGKLATILREQPLEQADNVRLRTIRQIQIAVLSSQAALQRMREQELRDQDFLNQNEIAQEYIRNTQILLQTIDIAENFTKNFQIVDSTLQQIVLALRDPEYNFIFPSVTDENFWSHVYRKVLADPENDNRRINFNRSIVSYFDDFDVSRKVPGTDNYFYNLPVVDNIHRGISHSYTSSIIQNVTMHLLSINLWMIHLFKGFLLFHQRRNNVQVPVMTIAKKAANRIINHHQYEDLQIEHEIPGLIDVYNRIKLIFDADFRATEPEDLLDYESAKAHPLKYLRVSYRLLQEASRNVDWPAKRWCLLPSPSSHRIVHFSLNSHVTMYGLFEKANNRNIRIPDDLLGRNGNFIGVTAFLDIYSGIANRQRIWETLAKLGFGLTTDGHMISVLFERVSREQIPFDTKGVKFQKRNLNLANKTRGIYPLYKNPTGITLQDRIIGIDPGVRDIVCAVDCTPQELTNKYTTKEHSLSISNASYKLRSGMQWINQKELQSRNKERMQDSYDRLKSSKVSNTYEIRQFLNSVYQEHKKIFDFMKSYKHRENKGHNYSNRQRAQDHVARVILGTTNKEERYKLSHDSSSSHQRKIRKRYRRTTIRRFSQNPRPSYPPSIRTSGNNNQRTVVAYGDASIRSTYKGNTPIPVKAIQRAIATKALVIPVDEFRTSVTCSHCFGRLETTPDERLYWNRDVNAASNIRQILTAYVEQGFDLESRPEQLSRGIRQQDEDNEET
ncbi:hypothetical protein HPULCUR_005078 [Helicostylum pulchrum]|uniref:Uncharacterized protein n=1 Tax=Helicostylum pulchrum TaxID=562976 RepID=A0ABP9XY28_9FUNG